jgi:hypothetical protein
MIAVSCRQFFPTIPAIMKKPGAAATGGVAEMDIPGKAVAGVAVATVLGLAACGSSGSAGGGSTPSTQRSASELVSQMKTAVRNASSMHLAGLVNASGKQSMLNLGLLRSGDFSGSITQNGVPLHLIGANGKYYIKATPAFLRQLGESRSVCVLMCGKYVQISGAQGSRLSGSLSMANLTRALTSNLPHMTRTGTATVAGQRAIELRGADGSTVDVAASGPPYPLRVISPPGHHERVLFSQWNQVHPPAPPKSSEVINLSKLKASNS